MDNEDSHIKKGESYEGWPRLVLSSKSPPRRGLGLVTQRVASPERNERLLPLKKRRLLTQTLHENANSGDNKQTLDMQETIPYIRAELQVMLPFSSSLSSSNCPDPLVLERQVASCWMGNRINPNSEGTALAALLSFRSGSTSSTPTSSLPSTLHDQTSKGWKVFFANPTSGPYQYRKRYYPKQHVESADIDSDKIIRRAQSSTPPVDFARLLKEVQLAEAGVCTKTASKEIPSHGSHLPAEPAEQNESEDLQPKLHRVDFSSIFPDAYQTEMQPQDQASEDGDSSVNSFIHAFDEPMESHRPHLRLSTQSPWSQLEQELEDMEIAREDCRDLYFGEILTGPCAPGLGAESRLDDFSNQIACCSPPNIDAGSMTTTSATSLLATRAHNSTGSAVPITPSPRPAHAPSPFIAVTQLEQHEQGQLQQASPLHSSVIEDLLYRTMIEKIAGAQAQKGMQQSANAIDDVYVTPHFGSQPLHHQALLEQFWNQPGLASPPHTSTYNKMSKMEPGGPPANKRRTPATTNQTYIQGLATQHSGALLSDTKAPAFPSPPRLSRLPKTAGTLQAKPILMATSAPTTRLTTETNDPTESSFLERVSLEAASAAALSQRRPRFAPPKPRSHALPKADGSTRAKPNFETAGGLITRSPPTVQLNDSTKTVQKTSQAGFSPRQTELVRPRPRRITEQTKTDSKFPSVSIVTPSQGSGVSRPPDARLPFLPDRAPKPVSCWPGYPAPLTAFHASRGFQIAPRNFPSTFQAIHPSSDLFSFPQHHVPAPPSPTRPSLRSSLPPTQASNPSLVARPPRLPFRGTEASCKKKEVKTAAGSLDPRPPSGQGRLHQNPLSTSVVQHPLHDPVNSGGKASAFAHGHPRGTRSSSSSAARPSEPSHRERQPPVRKPRAKQAAAGDKARRSASVVEVDSTAVPKEAQPESLLCNETLDFDRFPLPENR